jgi:hypothetical protein
VVRKALAKNRDERFETVLAFAHALEQEITPGARPLVTKPVEPNAPPGSAGGGGQTGSLTASFFAEGERLEVQAPAAEEQAGGWRSDTSADLPLDRIPWRRGPQRWLLLALLLVGGGTAWWRASRPFPAWRPSQPSQTRPLSKTAPPMPLPRAAPPPAPALIAPGPAPAAAAPAARAPAVPLAPATTAPVKPPAPAVPAATAPVVPPSPAAPTAGAATAESTDEARPYREPGGSSRTSPDHPRRGPRPLRGFVWSPREQRLVRVIDASESAPAPAPGAPASTAPGPAPAPPADESAPAPAAPGPAPGRASAGSLRGSPTIAPPVLPPASERPVQVEP